ncbi:heat shock [Datura stramonium]|uniref:Heat shock n=1 Tax=Datura stramonium TaxID=4076 RepID=A0ABS8UTG9_DATST|nr:heat shock [Datura stramonium]
MLKGSEQPSVVAYTKNGDRLVGQIAKRQAVVNPENTFFSVKRFIGRKMNEVDEESKQVSYNVIRDENGNVKLDCPAIGKSFAAEEISARFLRKLVDDASKFLNDKVRNTLWFSPVVLSLCHETVPCFSPFCAWLCCCDLLVLEVGDGVFEVLLSTSATPILVVMILTRLTSVCHSLQPRDGPKHIETTITRGKFEELCSDLLDRLKTPVQNSLRDAKFSLSDIDEVILVGGSTRIPAVQELVKKLTGKDPNVTVNPDEVVALGAAAGETLLAGVLAGDVSDIVLLDVTPLSIGLETLGGTSVEINVLQGEREFVRDNKSLGSFRLDGIPPAPRGVPQIEVKFDIDANGILSVTAVDKCTGKKQDITITGASTLPGDEVERMVKEAESTPPRKTKRRDAIDTKNQADSVVYQTEKQLKELGEKVPAPVKEKVEAKLGELKEAISGGSTHYEGCYGCP